MRVLILKNSVVINVIECESVQLAAQLFPAHQTTTSDAGEVGDAWDGSKFNKPLPVIVPDMVTMRQARLALLATNKLAAVNQAVANMTGVAGETVRIEWEFSSMVERNKPTVSAIAQALGWSSADLDQLFINAAKL